MATKTDPKPAQTTTTPAQSNGNGTQTKASDDFDLDFLASPVTLSADLTKVAAPQRERNERQQKMDETVRRAHDNWVKAGRPSTWPAAVDAKTVITYFAEPEKADALRKMINRATSFLGIRARYGSAFAVTPEMAKSHGLPESYVGREVISFVAMDKRSRASKDESK
jgi:hypothetical protein